MPTNGWEPATVWQIARADPEKARDLAREVGISPLVARILLVRGITRSDEARAFLSPRLADLEDPDLVPDLSRAADRIARAIREKQSVTVYGDYDVDGLTGTALLTSFLSLAGNDAEAYIPHRLDEGYGLNADAVRSFAERSLDLLVTVDHGTTATEEIALAQELGIDVVVLDHHTPGASPPPAFALVNPHLAESDAPRPCGVGVAFKTAWGVARALAGSDHVSKAHRAFLTEALALVALGTVSDVMPLRGENRIFTRFGLKLLSRSGRPGLRALLDVARIEGDEPTASDVAFRIAPRINAAGRLGRAGLALELLTTESEARAREIATALDGENRERRDIERCILTQALARIGTEYEPGHRGALVLADERWHAGVIGIVAARLVDRFHRPAALAAFEGGVGRGSCRSIPGLALTDALERCGEHLLSFGGHAAAAGFTVLPERFPAFRRAFDEAVRDLLEPEALVRRRHVDLVAPLREITPAMVRDLERLAPFGAGNPRPVLATRAVRVAGKPRRPGKEGRHLALLVTDGDATFRAIGFGMGERATETENAREGVDIAYTPRFDTWRGDGSVELELIDIVPVNGRLGS